MFINKDSQCVSDFARRTRAEAGAAKGYLRPAPLFAEGRGGGGGGVCVCVHCQSDRQVLDCIVKDFNPYWDALSAGGWHRLLIGPNCNAQEAWNGRQCNAV